ncbi:non-ribosomal peptide synthetase/type I polyketide synthase [Nostoc sp. NMS1]|uniref:non-ribosomal peptide synthetase/type I polyketide synthase n=1 Tax=Nostoc sp. NMS1 TaxID=2815388 RepID=UPI0025F7CBA5|nr:non-ribosomal peptide synthetase/type I polyketide synthase [Nostoc sp. NMS1]
MSDYSRDFKFSTPVDMLRFRALHQPNKTAFTFLADGETESSSLTYRELDLQAQAIATQLKSLVTPGSRALLLYPSSLEFIAAFFGCLYASVVAIPAYPPRRNQKISRLQAIINDAQATITLTTKELLTNIEDRVAENLDLAGMKWLTTDNLASEQVSTWQEPILTIDTLAFLQYTSGSTGMPKGVMVSHGNLLHNLEYIKQAFELTPDSVSVTWLPSFHDMGLIDGILQPIYTGFLGVVMPPTAFVQQPIRWLQAISRYKATHSGGPNFGYELCVKSTTSEQRQNLDLSSWCSAYSGAEPVRKETLEQFADTFQPCGFCPNFFYPCYGMAESTLMISGGKVKDEPIYCAVQADALEQNRVVKTSFDNHNARHLVGCGHPWLDTKIAIAHPESLTRCVPNQVGEIWVSGSSVSQGYWQQSEQTEQTFQAYLADTGEGPFLRTGDLGFLLDGELFITGRLKDLIIILGRNHYPQDIEQTVEQSHPALRANCGAAFAVDIGGQEKLVIVQEVERSYLRKLNASQVIEAICQAVAQQHDIEVYAVLLLKTASLPKTSSGKLQRSACRKGFLSGSLDVVADWCANPQNKTTFRHLETEVKSLLQQVQTTTQSAKFIKSKNSHQPATSDKSHSQKEIAAWLISKVSQQLQVVPEQIDIHQPLADYGLGSLAAVRLSGELQQFLGCQLAPSIFYDYPTITDIAQHLGVEATSKLDNHDLLVHNESTKISSPLPISTEAIAIIGLGCRFPGAKDPEAFWQLLRDGVDAIQEVPSSRWDNSTFYDPTPAHPGKMNTRWGGFLEQVDQFDPQFFGISPREAEIMDPQQRLLLEVSWEALENAGRIAHLAESQTGVFIGISNYDYSRLLVNHAAGTDAYYGTGNALSIAANRLSYLLDLQGPSWVVDTACSSSLVAIHQACQSLRQGECQLALAGGVNLILTPQLTITFSQTRMMAADGRCKVFDSSADGYVRGEGCGIVVLKRFSDAIKDGDNILALIRGSAVNQDGRSNGLTAPNGISQQQVIRQALQNAKVQPAQINYVETHGTGTSLGDPIEVNSLKEVLMEGRAPDQLCYIGSVKTNIGHLEAAAGIAGLIKVVLSLQHGEIPPHLHLKQLNPYISLANTPLSIPTQRQKWPQQHQQRLASISSFGFGGTNAHVILEEAPLEIQNSKFKIQKIDAIERPVQLLTLSAKSKPALRELVQRYQTFLERNSAASLADICFTANTGRSHFDHRLAIAAESTIQLRETLDAFASGKQTSKLVSNQLDSKQRPKIAFLFTGQGSQYIEMGRQLYDTQPTFRQTLDYCDEILRPYLEKPLLSVLYPTSQESSLLDQTAYTQPALFALEYALFQLWKSWGIVPDVVVGHSLGEYVAACVAGVFSLEDGLKLIAERARLIQTLPQNGEMVAVFADEGRIAAIIQPYSQEVVIAAINAPKNIVISGVRQSVEKIIAALETEGIETRRLKVSHAFHSPLMQPILDQFQHIASRIQFQAPCIPIISNLTGQMLPPGYIPDASYWRRHTCEAVRFMVGINTLFEQGYELFLEIGSKPILSTLGKRQQQGTATWLPSLVKGQDDWQVLLASLSTIYVQGIDVNWTGFDRDYSRHLLSLPTYPFQRQRYWIAEDSAIKQHNVKDLLHVGPSANFNSIGSNKDYSQNQPSLTSHSLPKAENLLIAENKISVNGVQPSQKRQDAIVSKLRCIVGDLLRVAPSEVKIHAHFLDMGADSIVLIDAIRNIENTYAIKITIRQLFEELTTIEALALYLDKNLSSEWAVTDSSPEPEVQDRQNGRQEQNIPETALEKIMMQQLQVMSQQLDVLRSNGLSSSNKLSALAHPTNVPLVHSDTARQKSQALFKVEAPKVRELSVQQQQHLEALILRYTNRTQQSKQRTQTYRPVIADRRSSTGFRLETKEMLYPIVGDRSLGSRIWDIDGNEYIDISMGFGVHLFGHRTPFVTEALEKQFQQGIQIGPQSKLAGEVAALICKLTGMERVTFCNSGTEAVMTALRLARAVTGRDKIVMFQDAYHGHSDGTLAIARTIDGKRQSVPMALGVTQNVVDDVLILPYGEPESLEIIKAFAHELAAVLVEPVPSRRPDLQPKTFLHELRQLTQAAGTVLIFDEVITGFRIHPGGAQAWFGINADIVTYGKLIGGGMPIGVVAGKAAYMDSIDGGMWNYGDESYPQTATTFFAGTFSKHPLTMAAAQAVLNHLITEGATLQQELNQRTSQLTTTLNAYFAQEDVPIKVVHFSSFFRFVLSGNSSYLYQPLELDLLFYHLIEKGVYIWEGRTCFLSTAHTDADIDYVIQAIQDSVEELRKGGFLLRRQEAEGRWSPSAVEVKGSTSATLSDRRQEAEGRWSPSAVEVRQQSSVSSQHSFEAAKDTQIVPLTEAQKQLWILTQIGDDGSLAYNVSLSLQLRGMFSLAAMHQAVQKVVDRHEAIRTVIDNQGEFQHILPFLKIDVPLIDFSDVDSYERESRVAEWFKKDSQVPLDLSQGPLFRIHILKLKEQLHLLVLTAHHIVVDGWSMSVILQEMGELYSAAYQGVICQLQPPMQFREYIEWQEQQSQTEAMAIHESYWLEKFGQSIPVLNLPSDRSRPAIKTYQGSRQTIRLDANLYRDLKKLNKEQGCTLFMTLLAVYTILLHRITTQDDLVVGIPSAGRSLEGSDRLVGYCAHILPIRSCVVGEAKFSEFLDNLKGLLLEAYEHHDYPFAKLLNQLRGGWDFSRSPLVTVTFNLERPVAVNMLGIETDLFWQPISSVDYDLNLNATEINGEIVLDCDYSTDLFDAATIERLLGHFQTLLKVIVAHPQQRISELPLLSASERHQLLVEWNHTQVDYPNNQCIHQIIAEQAKQTPEAVAIVFDNQQLTYRELNDRANQLAHYLQTLGVKPEVPVGICVERSLEMIVGLLGILKAGGAYVPLDPDYPQERLAYMLNDAQVSVLLTQKKLVKELPEHRADVICLDTDWQTISQQSQQNPVSEVAAENLAYIIYTSGSTGNPKGVMITHRNLVNAYMAWEDAYHLRSSCTSHLQMASFSFDVFSGDMVRALCSGAKLVICPREWLLEPEKLYNLLQQQQVDCAEFVPPVLRNLIQYLEKTEQNLSFMKLLIAGSDSWYVQEYQQFQKFLGAETRLINSYGVSEATIDSSYFESAAINLSADGLVPIGRPFANTKIYILDQNLQPVPIGVPGELYISGAGLARGYLNQPELTEQKFIHHCTLDTRLYKTGDRARYLSDGNIEFLGRLDHQVKIRGFRIELGEIESILTQHPAILQAVILVREDQPGNKRLVAYVVFQQSALTSNELRQLLKEKLPDYMIPYAFVQLDVLPLTPNGKINRWALPTPDPSQICLENNFVAPRTPTEEILADIWAEVLELEKVGIHDDFFEMGGHSLLATQLISRLREAFSIELPLRYLFESPTIAELAELLTAQQIEQAETNMLEQLLTEIDELSDEEVRQLLAE